MLEDVKNRLSSLGITVSSEPFSSDEMILNFSIQKVTNHIKNQTNLSNIPQGLNEIAIDMVVGEFLYLKKGMGQLTLDSIDFTVVAKRVQDGDTDTEFVIDTKSTPEAKFYVMVNYLQHNETDFTKYRVLAW